MSGPRVAAWRAGTGGEPDRDWQDLRVTEPTHLVATHQPLPIGDRTVDLYPLGPGHTDTDLVVHVPDAHTWPVGDVVEASGPPMYGSDCFPLGPPLQLAFLLSGVEKSDAVVPGHGPVVDRAFVESQHAEVERLAQQIWLAKRRGDTVEQALANQDHWPFPVQALELAVQRGYLALEEPVLSDQQRSTRTIGRP